MAFWILAGVLLAGGAGLGVWATLSSKRLFQIQATPTVKARELLELAKAVGTDIGAGSFRQIAELKGRADAPQPLVSELAGAECVWYRFTVTREYEETYYSTNAEGVRERHTRRGSETVATNQRAIPFDLVDDSGRLPVALEEAEITGVRSHSSFDQQESQLGGWLEAFLPKAGTRTLGYRREEHILPQGAQLYVLAEASDLGGALALRKPEDGKSLFLVSVKSEEALVREARSIRLWAWVGAGVCAAGAVASAVFALLNPGA